MYIDDLSIDCLNLNLDIYLDQHKKWPFFSTPLERHLYFGTVIQKGLELA